jgi:hypothetical protein
MFSENIISDSLEKDFEAFEELFLVRWRCAGQKHCLCSLMSIESGTPSFMYELYDGFQEIQYIY